MAEGKEETVYFYLLRSRNAAAQKRQKLNLQIKNNNVPVSKLYISHQCAAPKQNFVPLVSEFLLYLTVIYCYWVKPLSTINTNRYLY